MARDCPGCEQRKYNIGRHDRVIALADDLEKGQVRHILTSRERIDFVVTPKSYPRSKFGPSHVICACKEPGHRSLGAGVQVLWGRNGTRLMQYIEDEFKPAARASYVLLVLLPGTPYHGHSLPEIVGLLMHLRYTVRIGNFVTRSIVHVDAINGGRGWISGAPLETPEPVMPLYPENVEDLD